jgi:hypothetical protein
MKVHNGILVFEHAEDKQQLARIARTAIAKVRHIDWPRLEREGRIKRQALTFIWGGQTLLIPGGQADIVVQVHYDDPFERHTHDWKDYASIAAHKLWAVQMYQRDSKVVADAFGPEWRGQPLFPGGIISSYGALACSGQDALVDMQLSRLAAQHMLEMITRANVAEVEEQVRATTESLF